MAEAFVLVNTEIGSEEEVLATLKSIDAVKEAYMVYGVYDIVLKVGSDTMDILKNTILTKIRQMDRVRSTLTMIVVEDK